MKFVAKTIIGGALLKVVDGRGEDVYQLSYVEASDLLNHVEEALNNVDNGHIIKNGGTYKLILQISDRCSRSYNVTKRNLVELRIQLMGV